MKPRISTLSLSILLLVLALNVSKTLAAILGIDFGESYSKSVLLAPGVPFEPVLSSDSKRKDLVGITFKDSPGDNGIERFYGNSAQSFFVRYPSQSLFYFKPLLGAHYTNSQKVKNYQEKFPGISLQPTKNNRSTVSVSFLDESYPIEEIFAMYLLDIKNRASGILKTANDIPGSSIDTVITVPYSFDIFQRKAIEDASELADMGLISLVNDGVAVITNYVSKNQFRTTPEYHLVYDVGAGEVSASLFSVRQVDSSVVIELENVSYDDSIGGNYITSIVKSILVEKLLQEHKSVKLVSLEKDFKAMRKLWLEAERVKTILSANTEAASHIESVHEDLDLRVKISRAELEKALNPSLDKFVHPIFKTFESLLPSSSFKHKSQLNSIIYMGGSTRVPVIQREIIKNFGEDVISKKVNTDEAAAIGATLRGVGISKVFKSRNITVVERTFNDYTATIGSEKIPLFSPGDLLDTTNTLILPSITDDEFGISLSENDVEFSVIESKGLEKILSGYNCSLGEAQIKAKFKLTHSQTIELIDLSAECKPAPIPEEGDANKPVSDESADTPDPETGKATKSKTSKPKLKKVTLPRKHLYRNVRPMGTASKQSSLARLRNFERTDKDRKQREIMRNQIESDIYKVKGALLEEEDKDDSEKLSINLDELVSQVDALLEWLDYDSQEANIKILAEKQSEIKKILSTLRPEEEIPQTSLVQQFFKKMDDVTGFLKDLNGRSKLNKNVHDGEVRKVITLLKSEDNASDDNEEGPLDKKNEIKVGTLEKEANEILKRSEGEETVEGETAYEGKLQQLVLDTYKLIQNSVSQNNQPTTEDEMNGIISKITSNIDQYLEIEGALEQSRKLKLKSLNELLPSKNEKVDEKENEKDDNLNGNRDQVKKDEL